MSNEENKNKEENINKESFEKDIEERIEERENLYDVFEKEKWYIKFLKALGILEDASPQTAKDKIYNAGFNDGKKVGRTIGIVFILLCLLILWPLARKFYSKNFDNLNDIVYKIKEINYYVDKYYLYEKDDEKLEDYIAYGMMASLGDKYATYYTKEEYEELNEQVEGEYAGIGVVVIQDSTDGYLVVTKIYNQSDALNTTLAIGDKIIKVDDESVAGYTSDEVVSLVRGKEGTKVKLTVLKSDNNTTEDIEILRKKIEQELVEGKILENNIGYIAIDQFEGKAYEQFMKIKEEFEEKNIQGLIIDLRNNPGGNLNVLKDLASIFLDKKLITYFKYNNDEIVNYYSTEGAWDIPVVILINEYSASASEAFTGALKDHGIATVVGKQSYGKGIVQQVVSLHDKSAIKFTIADYYTPNGINITGEGITPDVEVEYQYDDNQLETAQKVLLEKINNK